MRVCLLDDYQGVATTMADWARLAPRTEIHAIREHIDGHERLVSLLRPYEIVVAMRERTPFPRALFAALPNLKLLVTAGQANAAIDIEAATDHGVQVCGTRGWPHATAELALGLMLALARHIPAEDHAMHRRGWQTSMGIGLHGRTLGLLGLGTLGRQMARFGAALGMRVLAWSQNLTAEAAAEHGAELKGKHALLASADVVSIHLRLSERTRGLIGREELALMKPTALLINTSRGPIIDEAALIEHLRNRRIAGAALDVFDREPLPLDHPLRELPNTVLTPHLGYVVEENYRIVYGDAVDDVEAFLNGRALRPLNTLPGPA